MAIGVGVGAAVVVFIGLVIVFMRGTHLFSDHDAVATTSAPTASASASRQANLVILPDDASVEVDGAAVSPTDGVVKIVGAVGSTHRVRISKDGQEKIADVVIGHSGAEPPKVELVISAAPATSAPATTRPIGGPRVPATKKGATPGAPTPPVPRKPLIPERFE